MRWCCQMVYRGGPPSGPIPPNRGGPLHLLVVRTSLLGMLMTITTSSRLIRVTSTKLTARISSPISRQPERRSFHKTLFTLKCIRIVDFIMVWHTRTVNCTVDCNPRDEHPVRPVDSIPLSYVETKSLARTFDNLDKTCGRFRVLDNWFNCKSWTFSNWKNIFLSQSCKIWAKSFFPFMALMSTSGKKIIQLYLYHLPKTEGWWLSSLTITTLSPFWVRKLNFRNL